MDLSASDRLALHVAYEVEALARCAVLTEKYERLGDADTKNACLEATLAHVRLMIEFLFGRPRTDGTRRRRKDDVQPRDFVTGWSPDLPPHIDEWLDLADKWLAHLSTARANPEHVDLDLVNIADTILAAFETFAALAEQQGADDAVRFVVAAQSARRLIPAP